MDYSSWVEKPMQVTSLLLDPKNPRIPAGPSDLDQRSLIAELVKHEKVYELAKEIAENGYFPIESLVGWTDDGKTYVLEGNRRLAALKLLVSPDLASEERDIKRFRTLAAAVSIDSIKKVHVVFAPTREAAAPLIMQKHTKDQVERWSPLMQARYFRSLAAGGLSAEDLASRYKLSKSDVAAFLRLDSMYEAACSLTLPPAVREVVHDPRTFSASVLQRIIDSPKARDFLGVTFDGDGQMSGKVHVDEFRKGLTRILTDIAQQKVDTRKLNTAADVERYIHGFGKDAPDLSKTGSFSASDLTPSAASVTKPASPKSAKTTTPTRRSKSLIPSGLKCRVSNQKIREVYEELRKLDVEKFPNTSAAMLRILLELSIGNYLDKTGQIAPLLSQAQKSGRRGDWYPSWKQMLQEILKEQTITVNQTARKKLNKLVSDKDFSSLDGYVHNRFVTAQSRDLRDLAGALEEIFEVVLADPPKATGKAT